MIHDNNINCYITDITIGKSVLLLISTCHPAFVVEPVLLAGSRVVIRSESAYFPAGQKVPILCLARVVDY